MSGVYTGMIAQEVERVFPEWIEDGPDGFKTLTVIGFEGLVVEALRTLREEKDAEIARLRAKKDAQIGALREETSALAHRVARMEALMARVAGSAIQDAGVESRAESGD